MKGYKPKITLDTSVIVKWFRKEDDREYALLIREWITENDTYGMNVNLPKSS